MIKILDNKYKKDFDAAAVHPLQSWSWGEFREKLGQKVIRLGKFQAEKLVEVTQISIHKIPHTPWTIGYCPRGILPDKQWINAIKTEVKKYNCLFVKFEPNVLKGPTLSTQGRTLSDLGLRPGKSLFTPNTFQLDLTKSEEELLAGMKPKTRYNIRLAEKKGVVVEEDNSDQAFAQFQKLTEETASRQRFFAHNQKYRQLMWETMKDAGLAKLFVARYVPNVIPSDPELAEGEPRDLAKRSETGEILATWIIFLFNNIGYYPYGASSDKYRELMASNLLAWKALQLAKRAGCKKFDFWGSLGPSPAGGPDTKDPWYGFHRFKEGYGGELVEFVGTWDMVINPLLYSLYIIADKIRWRILRLMPI